MDKNITKINVEVVLSNEDAKFFEFVCDLNKKEGNFKTPREFVEFLFMTGFTFVRGQFIGSMMADMMSKEPPAFATFLGKMQPMVSMKISPMNQDENIVDFDRVFFDGEPAEHRVSKDGISLEVKSSAISCVKDKWHSIYMLKQNKPLKWKGDSI